MVRYVAAFRAYEWDDDIAGIADRFFASCRHARHVVLLDESKGEIDIGRYEKVSHTDQTDHLGLPCYPTHKSLWYNCDYGLYILRQALPDYDYYILSESDLTVNTDLEAIVKDVYDKGIEFVARDIRPSTSDWQWHENASATYEEPWRVILFFMIVAAKVADLLYRRRVDLAKKLSDVFMRDWPFCEPFVISTLKQDAISVCDVASYADVENLQVRPRLSINDPRANRPGSLAHSVLGSRRFIQDQFWRFPVRTYFQPTSPLRKELATEPSSLVAEILREVILDREDRVSWFAFQKGSGLKATSNDCRDLALDKPALSSSVGQWSRQKDTERDAGGANGSVIFDDFGFHTDHELNPWWLVDLVEESVVDEIRIINRVNFRERFITFQIASSRDAAAWSTRFVKLDLTEVSADLARPWSQQFSDPFVARYVKISLIGLGFLHLRKVQVFGRCIVVR